MPITSQNLRRWIEQSDIDYITHYIKAWIPFNAWYNSEYANLNTDREKINRIKNVGNPIRNKINNLMEGDDQESQEFKSYLASLHNELVRTTINSNGQRIWFHTAMQTVNPQNQISENYNRLKYFLRVDQQNRTVSNVQINLNKLNDNSRVFQYNHTEYDLNHLLQNQGYTRLSQRRQEQIRFYYQQLQPVLIENLIEGAPVVGNVAVQQNFYDCDGHNFKRDPAENACYAHKVCTALIEVLYQLRNVLFHGEIAPTTDNQKVYKNAYFCLKYLLEALR